MSRGIARSAEMPKPWQLAVGMATAANVAYYLTFGVLVLAGLAHSVVLYDPLALLLFSGALMCLNAVSLGSLRFYRTATVVVMAVATYTILFGGPFLPAGQWLIMAALAYSNAAAFHLFLNRIAPGWVARARARRKALRAGIRWTPLPMRKRAVGKRGELTE